MSRISHAVSGLQSITMKNPGELSTPWQTFDHPCFPIEGGYSTKGYDREKAGEIEESKERRRKRRRKEGRKKEQKERRKWRNQRHHRPSTPQTHLLLPLFSYPSRTLPRVTPLDHSRHSSYLLPSSALYLSLFSLYLSRSFDLVSHTSSLFNFTPCFDFMRTAKWGYLLRSCSSKCVCTQ